MRFVVLLALAAACSGPVSRPYLVHHDDPGSPSGGPRIQRPPENAPPDPIGTSRPGTRSCSEARDCRPGDTCFAPDFKPTSASACKADAGCTAGQVCEPAGCVAPCSDTSCGLGKICRRDGHCVPVPCNEPGAPLCPLNSRCNAASGACDRQNCATRSECDSGVCFQGRCFAHDAFCAPQNFCCTP